MSSSSNAWSARRWLVAVMFVLAGAGAFRTVCAQSSETARVTTPTASLRAEPKANAAVLTTLKAGAKLEVRSADGDWYRVATLVGNVRVQGYVLKKSVTIDKPGEAGPVAAPAGAPKMSATVVDAGKTVPLTASLARVGRMAARADSVHAAAMAIPIGAGTPLPSAPASMITYLWLIDDVKAARVVTAAGSFSVQFRDVPGVSPDDFEPAIVTLATTPSGPRLVRALRGRVDQASRREADWDVARDLKQDIVKATVQVTERGVATLTPAAKLAPGEYAVVLRPIGNKKFSGASVLSPAADGRVFGIAWVFVVK